MISFRELPLASIVLWLLQTPPANIDLVKAVGNTYLYGEHTCDLKYLNKGVNKPGNFIIETGNIL